jgi:predicted Holliday junction resolvase-like endonuclease
VEFKTGAAQLTPRQRNIKKLIAEGKVRFEEIRF